MAALTPASFNTPRRLPPPPSATGKDGNDGKDGKDAPGDGGGNVMGDSVGYVGGLVSWAVMMPFTAVKRTTDVIVANSPFAM